ncbi:hypothetical protein OE88DRAFT_1668985 [Heliocybe sulcata]|uniref:HAT C-terminal dimerisation domain-containing protein n=1 Tax=Heliocybe sulcata TaxID=5364 RepID=A0A5C3MLT8_9AGAM|nr:hypothetical protein OE88DRAFT_1668985 [Heliocybe sulcata]
MASCYMNLDDVIEARLRRFSQMNSHRFPTWAALARDYLASPSVATGSKGILSRPFKS